MFATPRGWRVESSPEGSRLTTSGPGRIVVEETVRPVARASELLAQVPVPGLVIDDVESLVTSEGEYAALAHGRSGEHVYWIGFVLLDDSYMRIVGAAPVHDGGEAVSAAVREIVMTTRVWLGNPRRRPYRYDPPASWQRVVAGGDETWLAPGGAMITVPRALPSASRAQMSVAATLLALADVPGEPPQAEPVSTRRGLAGQRWVRTIATAFGEKDVVVVALTDERYDYFARLIAPRGARGERAVLDALVESIEPLPANATAAQASPLAFWV